MQHSTWHLMQDGVVFFNFNHQGSPRGGDELAVQNWWMGMAERPAGAGRLRFTLMLSLEPATLGKDGYREIFQVGETLDDRRSSIASIRTTSSCRRPSIWRQPSAAATR